MNGTAPSDVSLLRLVLLEEPMCPLTSSHSELGRSRSPSTGTFTTAVVRIAILYPCERFRLAACRPQDGFPRSVASPVITLEIE